MLKKLENSGAKFASVDKKQAYTFPPNSYKSMVEVYIAYDSHSSGNEAPRTEEQDGQSNKKLKEDVYIAILFLTHEPHNATLEKRPIALQY